MFEKKSPQNDPLSQIISGNILLDINLEQGLSGFENHPSAPKPLTLEAEQQESIMLSPFSEPETDIHDAGDINLEYYDGRENNVEDEFATFCMLQFNLNDKNDVMDFIKNEANLERSIAHIDRIYSMNQGFLSKQSHDPNSYEKGVFTELLLSHNMTQDEIAVLFTTMKHFNHHKSLQQK